ncbi:hypothetical protein SAMN02745157_4246 [Kaistia soli DSM 19436]|uniref:Chorismate lyase n=1 Tax=Kaistia soli DSM 19436 TaxID=1122133 RepID=A0A1M5JZ79_9HYPH|nr:hypothetical protein [Kaistia soli]SHG45818.1 hypothetical protein SAMN02745157_4246 [Kaistia soli DSM 19436]
MSRRLIAATALAAALHLAGLGQTFARAAEHQAWPDTAVTRLAALALIQTLNAELLSSPSATLTLDRWCNTHALAPAGSKIIAERITGQDKAADPEIRERLEAAPDEAVAYRRVRLTCGTHVLSEADNWYLPARLTDEMNQALETTSTSFGRVVAPLRFTRTTLDATLLWQPLPETWALQPIAPATKASSPLAIPDFLLRHRAVLKRADGRPFSLVVESYTGNILAFPAPAIP